MKNVLKNTLFSFCFTEQREIRAISPFIYSCARKKLWTETGALKMEGKRYKGGFHRKKGEKGKGEEVRMGSKRIRDAAFFFIIMLVTFAATLLKPQNYVSSRTIQKCVEHVSTST